MATLVLPKPRLLKNAASPSGYICNPKGAGYMLRHMRENPRVPPSFLGGGPDNDYAIDEKNLVLNIVEEGVSGREAVVVIQSAGKDFSTPCGLRMNSSGYWKISRAMALLLLEFKRQKKRNGIFKNLNSINIFFFYLKL